MYYGVTGSAEEEDGADAGADAVVVETATEAVGVDALGDGGIGAPSGTRVSGGIDEKSRAGEYLQLVEVALESLKDREEKSVEWVAGDDSIGNCYGRRQGVGKDNTMGRTIALVHATGIANGELIAMK